MLSSGDVSARCPPGNKRSASRCSERARGVRSIHSSRHLGGPIAVQNLLTRGVRVQGTWFSRHHNDAVWPRFGRSSDKKLTKWTYNDEFEALPLNPLVGLLTCFPTELHAKDIGKGWSLDFQWIAGIDSLRFCHTCTVSSWPSSPKPFLPCRR